MAGKISGEIRCSFCNKTQEEARKLIAGPGGVYICDECIDICADIIEAALADASVAIVGNREHIASLPKKPKRIIEI